MKEIEVKVIDIDKKDIERKLKRLGAKKVFEGTSYSFFYDFPDRRLEKNKKYIRLRKENDIIFITQKTKISNKNAKIMRELEVNVENFKIMNKILENIGLTKKKVISKKRTSYKLGNTKFEFDKNPKIPWYLEIESSNIKTIHRFCSKLGIKKDNLRPWSTKEAIDYYNKGLF